MKKEMLKRLPAVDTLLRDAMLSGFTKDNPRRLVVDAIRAVLERKRGLIKKGNAGDSLFSIEELVKEIGEEVGKARRPSLKRVINATGIIIHTNLGRAPLAVGALKNLADASLGYSNLEFDVEKGERGERYSHLEPILCKLTGAEAAMVVNNNAAAVMLLLNTLAEGKEVLVSRGELVEIGGSFRIPDIMKKSGARLVEVGTTNRTHIRDYEAAITPETALILKVHRSNFDMVGFTADVSIEDLAELGKRHGIPVMNDLGSGSLIDLSKYGMKKEPTVQDAVRSGIDVVAFSGDKLLGGPQAGIIIGRKEIIDPVKKNPLTRALRIDKLTIAALEATLNVYLDEVKAVHDIPVLRMLRRPVQELAKTARKILRDLGDLSDRFKITIKDGYSQVGGGALPLQEIPTKLLAVRPTAISPNQLERSMRMNHVPIIVRIERDEVVLDMRTLMDGDAEVITGFFRGVSVE